LFCHLIDSIERFSIVVLNHLSHFDDVMINIYQMEHRYKQQEENQSRVITEKNQKKKVKSNENNL